MEGFSMSWELGIRVWGIGKVLYVFGLCLFGFIIFLDCLSCLLVFVNIAKDHAW